MKRRELGLALVSTAVLLGGCAAMRTVRSDVSTFGEWPAGRVPGRFAFDRLPSQQADARAAERIEQAARPALARAGFTEAAAGETADVTVQVAARTTRTDVDVWLDPLWWRGGFGAYPRRVWIGPAWGLGLRSDFPRVEREVALLLRDHSSGKPLYEARATLEGSSGADDALLSAMFRAALTDFPRSGLNPRTVAVELE